MIGKRVTILLCLAFSVLLLSFSTTFSTNYNSSDQDISIKGTPRVTHYTKQDYLSDSQFWVMTEDAEGVLYFGNNDGIAVYNGEKWSLIRLPNGSTVRGLKYASDGYVYVGGYNQIGRVSKDQYGTYHYESLNDLLRTEDQTFDDVWQVKESNGYIVFRSFKRLIAIKGTQAITLPADGRIVHMSVVHDQLYIVDSWGIKELSLKTMEFENLVEASQYKNEGICSLLPGRDTQELIAFSRQGNSYTVDLAKNELKFQRSYFENESSDQIFCAIKSSDGLYYLGTINSKLRGYDLSEGADPSSIDFDNIQDNTVLGLYQTRDGNIWTLLNKGVDCLETASSVTKIFDNAAVYDAARYRDKIYLATNQGVYSAPYRGEHPTIVHKDFDISEGLEAQAWSFAQFEDRLIVSHDRGVFVIEQNRFYHVEGTNGIWKVLHLADDLYLACGYDGLYVLQFKQGKFVLRNTVEGFDVSGRDIVMDSDAHTFWVCHGYKGVYHIKLDQKYLRTLSLEKYTDQNGLPSAYYNNVFLWESDTVFTSKSGVFTFDKQKNQFVIHDRLTDILGKDLLIRKIVQKDGKTWFIQEDQLGYFNTDEEQPKLYMDPFLSLKGTFMKSMEYVYPTNNEVLVGTNNGLYSFELQEGSQTAASKTLITRVSYKNQLDSILLCDLIMAHESKTLLPNNTSSLLLEYATPQYSSQKDLMYRYKLDDMDKNWSAWDLSSEKEFSYLKSGVYTFRVQSRTTTGIISEEAIFHFEILPVWYQTNYAKVLFFILALVIILLVRVFVKRKLKQTKLEAEKMKLALELEIENIKLEKEMHVIELDKKTLEEDVIFKSKELANYTILLIKKRELLTDLAEELKVLKEKIKLASNREIIRSLTRKININLQDEEHLNVFDTNFERVHQDFFNELKTNYPNLTQKEMRLCGFVRMNLTNKEIAAILNISVRGVETARYRLRKILSIGKEISMVEFLEKLSANPEDGMLDSAEEEYFKD